MRDADLVHETGDGESSVYTLLMTFLSVPFAVYDITPQLSKTCYRLQMKN